MTRGLMKTTSSIAVAAAAGLFATSAMAADLGGNCCADLEERVAELEATTARKGNRKVSLTVWGQVNKQILWHDDDAGYREGEIQIRDNAANTSKFGFRGEAQIRPDLTAGYAIEIGITEDWGVKPNSLENMEIRHNYVYLDSARVGRLSLGQTSQVTDGLFFIDLANTQVTPQEMDEGGHVLSAPFTSTFAGVFDGARRQGIYYRSPSLAGFMLSAGYSHDTQGAKSPWTDANNDAGDAWEVALRYAGEFNGIRIAAGIGYRGEEAFDAGDHWDRDIWMASGSVMHTPTGLFLSGGYADRDSDDVTERRDAHWIRGGVERNFFGIGNTTLFAEYGAVNIDRNSAGGDWVRAGRRSHDHYVYVPNSNADVLDGNYWGLGLVQSIDAAATDLYINFRRYELDGFATTSDAPRRCEGGHGYSCSADATADGRDASVINAGMIIRF